MQPGVLSLVDHAHPAATEFLDDAVMRDGLADHGVPNGKRDAGAGQRRAPMESGKGKSTDFRLSEALAYPVVKKGFLRSSRKWMNLLTRKLASLLVPPGIPLGQQRALGDCLIASIE